MSSCPKLLAIILKNQMELVVLPSLENLLTRERFLNIQSGLNLFLLVFHHGLSLVREDAEDGIAFSFWGGVNFYFQNDITVD